MYPLPPEASTEFAVFLLVPKCTDALWVGSGQAPSSHARYLHQRVNVGSATTRFKERRLTVGRSR